MNELIYSVENETKKKKKKTNKCIWAKVIERSVLLIIIVHHDVKHEFPLKNQIAIENIYIQCDRKWYVEANENRNKLLQSFDSNTTIDEHQRNIKHVVP